LTFHRVYVSIIDVMKNNFESNNTNNKIDMAQAWENRNKAPKFIARRIGALALATTLATGIGITIHNAVSEEKQSDQYSFTTKVVQPGDTAWKYTTEPGNGYYDDDDNQGNVATFNEDNKDGAMADGQLQPGETVVVRVDNQENNPK